MENGGIMPHCMAFLNDTNVTGWQSLAVLRLALVIILVVAVTVQISVPTQVR